MSYEQQQLPNSPTAGRNRPGPRRYGMVLATVLLSVSLAACGTSPTPTSAEKSSSGDLPSNIASKGYITFGQYIDGPPDTYQENGEMVGWQNDLARAVAKELGVEAKIEPVSTFDSIIPGLQSKRYDTSFNSYFMTAVRRQAADFVTVFKVGTQFATASSSSLSFSAASDLCGHAVAAQAGSAYIGVVQDISKTCTKSGAQAVALKTYPSETAQALAVTTGRAEAAVSGTNEVAIMVQKSQGKLKLQPFVTAVTLEAEAFPKGSELVKPVAAALNKLIANGEYMKILKKWNVEAGAITEAQVNPTDQFGSS